MTPQEIRERIKSDYPEYYNTDSQRRNVEKGHYGNLDHALQAQIYVSSRGGRFLIDRSQKPFVMTIGSQDGTTLESRVEDDIETENLERLEAGIGTLYVLGTNVFTRSGEEIIKIGITTGNVEDRIGQLYTTGVPYRFRTIRKVETQNYYELEQSIHKLLDPFRINRSREFFTEKAIPFVEQMVELHNQVLKAK